MEFVSQKGDEPDCRLSIEAKIIIAWYRSLDEMDRAALDLFVAALQERHKSLKRFEAHAILDNVQERQFLAA